jgi:hypothetical protein
MVMQLRTKEVVLGDDWKIVVSEAGWEYSFRFTEAEKELEPKLSDPNHNEVFKFFCRNYYSLLTSCIVDGKVPTPEEAFALPRLHLDNWYWTVWQLNEDLMGTPCPKTTEHEEVTFRDGSSVVVWQSHGLPSFVLKLVELEQEALQHPLENDPKGQMFVSLFYPKLAASCNGSGSVPDSLSVRNWPRSEINKWMEASRRQNPSWFEVSEEEKVEVEQANKKKARKRSAG